MHVPLLSLPWRCWCWSPWLPQLCCHANQSYIAMGTWATHNGSVVSSLDSHNLVLVEEVTSHIQPTVNQRLHLLHADARDQTSLYIAIKCTCMHTHMHTRTHTHTHARMCIHTVLHVCMPMSYVCWTHSRCMQAFFFLPGPPYFFMSLQWMQVPQSVALHPEQSPQRVRRLAPTATTAFSRVVSIEIYVIACKIQPCWIPALSCDACVTASESSDVGPARVSCR